jgi:hypothetical protein
MLQVPPIDASGSNSPSQPDEGSLNSELHPGPARRGALPPLDREAGPDPSHLHATSPPLPERHINGGSVMLERSPSGRLPPAYGEQSG